MSLVPSLAKFAFNVLTAVKHMQNLNVLIIDCIDDYVLPDRKAAQASAQILAGASYARMLAKQIEALRNGVDDAIGRNDVAAFLDNIIPYVAEFGPCLRCEAMRHITARGGARRSATPGRSV